MCECVCVCLPNLLEEFFGMPHSSYIFVGVFFLAFQDRGKAVLKESWKCNVASRCKVG